MLCLQQQYHWGLDLAAVPRDPPQGVSVSGQRLVMGGFFFLTGSGSSSGLAHSNLETIWGASLLDQKYAWFSAENINLPNGTYFTLIRTWTWIHACHCAFLFFPWGWLSLWCLSWAFWSGALLFLREQTCLRDSFPYCGWKVKNCPSNHTNFFFSNPSLRGKDAIVREICCQLSLRGKILHQKMLRVHSIRASRNLWLISDSADSFGSIMSTTLVEHSRTNTLPYQQCSKSSSAVTRNSPQIDCDAS